MFVIVIRGWNCAAYLDRCIKSLYDQTISNWRAHIIIDESEDGSADKAMSYIGDKIDLSVVSPRRGVGHNLFHGIKSAHAQPGDIVGILDADDYLYACALSVIQHAYNTKRCLATYGSFMLDTTREKSRICKPYKKDDIPREAPWRATHFKTFRAEIFDYIPEEYFKHKGEWVKCASDLALMMSVMEIAGMNKCLHIPKVIYHYRNHTPFSVNRDKQKKYDKIIRAKRPLRRIIFE